MTTWTIHTGTLRIVKGDLTTMDVDAIVNAANSRLAGGGGVDGAIHRAAGHARLQKACRTIINEQGPLAAGQAVITPGFKLPARHIIHTVGPIWRGGSENEPVQLEAAYRNSLLLARETGIRSIAFPAISCGVYGYPEKQAAAIALDALADGLQRELVRETTMVLHGAASFEIWLETARSTLT